LIPANLSTVAVEIDVRRLAKKVLDVFEQHGIDQAAKRDLLEALSQRTRPGPGNVLNRSSASGERGIGPPEQ
jgi:hypothetical protein